MYVKDKEEKIIPQAGMTDYFSYLTNYQTCDKV